MTINLFKEDRKDIYHFIQIYKKNPDELEVHPIKVIKVVFSSEMSKLFFFYKANYPRAQSIHLLTSSYLNYLVDYEINEWMSLKLYFISEEVVDQTFDFKIIAKNDFSSQEVNVTLIIENEVQISNFSILWIIIPIILVILIGLVIVVYCFIKHKKKKKQIVESPVKPKSKSKLTNNNIELKFVD